MSEDQSINDVDELIEKAKWKMYGEEWTQASHILQDAKTKAVQMKDKARIDVILDLQKKASNQQKVPVP